MFLKFLALILSFPLLALADKVEVDFNSQVNFNSGEDVRLFAFIDNKDAAVISDNIFNLVIFEKGELKGAHEIMGTELVAKVRHQLSEKVALEELRNISFKVADKIKLTPKRNYIYPQLITRAIIQQSKNFCADCTVQIGRLNLPVVADNTDLISWKFDPSNISKSSEFASPLQAETSTGTKSLWVTGQIRFYRMAPVASRQIKFGERILAKDFTMKSIDYTFAKDNFPKLEDVEGKTTNKFISMNQPLYLSDLAREQGARQGQMVRLIMEDQGLEIETQAMAQESGFIGDSIKVKTTDTQKVLTGQLTEKNTVRIE